MRSSSRASLLALAGLASILSSRAGAEPRVTALDLRPAAGAAELRIRIEGGPVAPEIARLPGPRLVIDLPSTSSALESHRIETRDPLIRRVRVGLHPGRVRIVLDLGEGVGARCEQDEQGLSVVASPAGGARPSPTPRPSPTVEPASPGIGPAPTILPPVRPGEAGAAPAPSAEPAPSAPPTVSLDFDHADVQTVLDLIARVAGRKVIFLPSVRGRLSVHIDDRPWQEAFRLVLRRAHLRATFHEDLILVGPAGRS